MRPRASGGIERRGGLVQQEELGLVREGAGEGDALALSARELTGRAREHPGGKADAEGERVEDLRRERGVGEPRSSTTFLAARAPPRSAQLR
jgi:hypothetical protein